MDFGLTLQTDPPASRVDRAVPARRGARLHPRVDVRLPHPVAGALRHPLADPLRDRADDGRAARDQPRHARPHGHGVGVRDAQRHVRQPHRLRDRARRLGPARARRASRRRWPRPSGRSTTSASSPRAARSRRHGAEVRIPWVRDGAPRGLDGRLRPKALAVVGRMRRRLRAPGGRPGDPALDARPRPRGRRGGGARPRRHHRSRRAPAYVGDDLAHARDQCRWFGGMVGNHVAEIVERYGSHSDGPARADRLHRGPQGLRLHAPRPRREPGHRVRARRDRRPLLRPRAPPRPTSRSCGSSRRRGWTSSPSTSCTTRTTDARRLRRPRSSRR